MTNSKHKDLLRDFVSNQVKLPNIKEISVCNILDVKADENLARFLAECTPNQLGRLTINIPRKTSTGIKCKFYVSSLVKSINIATDQVLIHCFDFSEEEFSQIMKAACNAENVVFDSCDIHCSAELDFGSKIKYKTKYLSFQNCGSNFYKARTTDWKADPALFSKVVNAISKSGLKDSLEKINICNNHTLDEGEIQELFNDKGMKHISVVKDNSP